MNDHTRWRSVRTVNLHLASPVRSRWWTKLQSDLYLLLVDLVVIFYCSNWYWSWIMGGPVSECSLWRYYSSTFYMAIVIGGSSVACCWEEQHIPCNASSVAITIFTALVIRVSLSVIWWRGAESCSSQMTLLVYIAVIARVAWVVLSWEWDGLSTWLWCFTPPVSGQLLSWLNWSLNTVKPLFNWTSGMTMTRLVHDIECIIFTKHIVLGC